MRSQAVELPAEAQQALSRQQAFGFTQEDLKFLLQPMAVAGEEGIGSMGNDSPLAVLSNKNKTLYGYFNWANSIPGAHSVADYANSIADTFTGSAGTNVGDTSSAPRPHGTIAPPAPSSAGIVRRPSSERRVNGPISRPINRRRRYAAGFSSQVQVQRSQRIQIRRAVIETTSDVSWLRQRGQQAVSTASCGGMDEQSQYRGRRGCKPLALNRLEVWHCSTEGSACFPFRDELQN